MTESVSYGDDDLLPLSGIQHFAFCERQWALIYLEQQWAENVRTVEGQHMHERAHNPLLVATDGDAVTVRAVPLVSYSLGLRGQADVIEFRPAQGDACGIPLPGRPGTWRPRPIEYKRGRPKHDDRDAVQLCAQAICLEEMLGTTVDFGDLYCGETRRRERVAMDSGLRMRVQQLAVGMHTLFAEQNTPHAVRGKHCRLCSIVDLCLPNLTIRPKSVHKYIQDEIRDSP